MIIIDKLEYNKLLEFRKLEEIALFNIIKHYSKCGLSVREILNNYCNVPYKRALYILNKWSERGIYDYGVSLDMGWIIE